MPHVAHMRRQPVVLLLVVALLLGVLAGQSRANLPFQNPITKSMMQNNDGSKVREIMETLDSRGETGEQVKQMIFNSLLTDLTPLQSAAKYEAPDVARALLDHGAPIDGTDKRTESTPLAVASLQGSFKMVRLLVERGADVNRKDKDGRTPLMLASIDGHKNIIEHLIANNADLNLQELKGNTALQMAAFYCGDPRLMKMMVDEGAELNAVDHRQHSAVWLAASAGQVKCVKELLNIGADVTLVDGEGLDAASRAAEKGHKALALLIREHIRESGASGEL